MSSTRRTFVQIKRFIYICRRFFFGVFLLFSAFSSFCLFYLFIFLAFKKKKKKSRLDVFLELFRDSILRDIRRGNYFSSQRNKSFDKKNFFPREILHCENLVCFSGLLIICYGKNYILVRARRKIKRNISRS